jgi:hypothetical protein
MKSAKNTMLAQNMLAMTGGQADLPWDFASRQTPYIRAVLTQGRFTADQDEVERNIRGPYEKSAA